MIVTPTRAARIACALLLACTCTAQDDESEISLPEDLVATLEASRLAYEAGDHADARAGLQAVFDEGIHESLLEEPPEVLQAGLLAIDEVAALVGEIGVQERVRTERLEVLETIHDGTDPRVLAAKAGLAATRTRLGDTAGALPLEEEVYEVRARSLPEDDPDLLRAMGNLAVTLKQAGETARALDLELRVLRIRERTLPPGDPDLLRAKQGLAISRVQSGDLEGGHALFLEIHDAREQSLAPDDPDLLRAKGNLALTHKALGRLEEARVLEEQILAAWSRTLPPRHPDLLIAKQNLAVTRMTLGDDEGAQPLFEEVLEEYERTRPPENRERLISASNLAISLQRTGEPRRAHSILEGVYEIAARALPEDDPSLLRIAASLATTRSALGDFEGALVLEEKVHAAFERRLPPEHPDLLSIKGNLSRSRRILGDHAGALELDELVLAARERAFPEDHPHRLAAMMNLAVSRYAAGDVAGALELIEGVAHARGALPEDHPDRLQAELDLARGLAETGDLERASTLAERIRSVREEQLPAPDPDRLEAQELDALLSAARGRSDRAIEVARKALAGQRQLAISLYSEAPRVARATALREIMRLSSFLSVARLCDDRDTTTLDREIFEVLESLRLVSTSSAAHDVEADAELAALRTHASEARRALSDVALSAPGDAEGLATWRERVLAASNASDRAERELRSALVDQGEVVDVHVEDVAAALGEGEASVGFTLVSRPSAAHRRGWTPDATPVLLAFVVTPDAAVRRIELGENRAIEECVRAYRESLGRPLQSGRPGADSPDADRGIGGGSSDGDGQVTEQGAELRRLVVDPCIAAAGGEDLTGLRIVLDSSLFLVPLDALARDDGEPLGSGMRIRCATSLAGLLDDREALDEGTLVAAGAIDYRGGNDATSSMERSGPFEPLPGTGAEVDSIARLFGLRAEGEAVVLRGDSASKAKLLEQAGRARFLHVATHGWFASGSFAGALDARSEPFSTSTNARAEHTLHGFAPETLCGLALAGANRPADALGRPPGILTAAELATLDLSNCELAVLSACETNVGMRRAGQGIQSLQSALHAAGARSAITSLWRVDDAATRRLMELFYTRLWRDSASKADALWYAKMQLRSEGHPERDWAGWVLTGDPN